MTSGGVDTAIARFLLRGWFIVITAFASMACGGAASTAAAPKTESAKSEETPPGFPSKRDEGWCDPVPDLGERCDKELKECMIVCDYISDTCAMLVCMGGTWDYVERGEGARKDDE